MSVLTERYRPKSLDEVVGQELAVARLNLIRRKFGWEGQCILLCGPSGVGKTSIARCMAASVAKDFANYELDAQDVDFDVVRDWERKMNGKPLCGGVWAFTINEVHMLRDNVVSRLNTVFEKQDNCFMNATWLFTTTKRGQRRLFDTKFDAHPFLSRCCQIELDNGEEVLHAFANRVREIAVAEGLDGQDHAAYYRLATECEGNFREMLHRVASGDMLLLS